MLSTDQKLAGTQPCVPVGTRILYFAGAVHTATLWNSSTVNNGHQLCVHFKSW